MCQPRLAVTRFNVPAKCHFGCLWNQRTIETLPHKDYLINRIISPSILSQLCDNVKREQENNQSIFVMKLCHPPSVVCSHLNHNGKWRYVFVFHCFLYFAVNFLPLLCFRHIWLMILSAMVRFYYLAHADALIFTGLYRYGCWTQLLYIILTPIVKGMSISFCWGYLMLIKTFNVWRLTLLRENLKHEYFMRPVLSVLMTSSASSCSKFCKATRDPVPKLLMSCPQNGWHLDSPAMKSSLGYRRRF